MGGVWGGVSVCSSGNEHIPDWLLLLLPLLELRWESVVVGRPSCPIELLVLLCWLLGGVAEVAGGPVSALICC